MKKGSCSVTKHPCKICFQTVTKKNGVQCQGVCKKWVHFECLNFTPGKIKDIKAGHIKIMCPCPDCNTEPKEIRLNPPFTCTNEKCPANSLPKCQSENCPLNDGMVCGKDKCSKNVAYDDDCPPIPESCPSKNCPQPHNPAPYCPPKYCTPPHCPQPHCPPQHCPPQHCPQQHAPPKHCPPPPCPPQHCPPPPCPPQRCPPKHCSPPQPCLPERCSPPPCSPQHSPPKYCPPPPCPPKSQTPKYCPPKYCQSPQCCSPSQYGPSSPYGSSQSLPPLGRDGGCCSSGILVRIESNPRVIEPTDSNNSVGRTDNLKSKSCICVSKCAGPGSSHFGPPAPTKLSISDSRISFVPNKGNVGNNRYSNNNNRSMENALEQMCKTVGLLSHQIRELMCKIMDKAR